MIVNRTRTVQTTNPPNITVLHARGTFFVIGDTGDPPEVHERAWERRPFHYDDVFDAMCTLFAVQTSEGWVK